MKCAILLALVALATATTMPAEIRTRFLAGDDDEVDVVARRAEASSPVAAPVSAGDDDDDEVSSPVAAPVSAGDDDDDEVDVVDDDDDSVDDGNSTTIGDDDDDEVDVVDDDDEDDEEDDEEVSSPVASPVAADDDDDEDDEEVSSPVASPVAADDDDDEDGPDCTMEELLPMDTLTNEDEIAAHLASIAPSCAGCIMGCATVGEAEKTSCAMACLAPLPVADDDDDEDDDATPGCVDDPTGQIAGQSLTCDMLLNTMSVPCAVDLNTMSDAAPVGSFLYLACPLSCGSAAGGCDVAPPPTATPEPAWKQAAIDSVGREADPYVGSGADAALGCPVVMSGLGSAFAGAIDKELCGLVQAFFVYGMANGGDALPMPWPTLSGIIGISKCHETAVCYGGCHTEGAVIHAGLDEAIVGMNKRACALLYAFGDNSVIETTGSQGEALGGALSGGALGLFSCDVVSGTAGDFGDFSDNCGCAENKNDCSPPAPEVAVPKVIKGRMELSTSVDPTTDAGKADLKTSLAVAAGVEVTQITKLTVTAKAEGPAKRRALAAVAYNVDFEITFEKITPSDVAKKTAILADVTDSFVAELKKQDTFKDDTELTVVLGDITAEDPPAPVETEPPTNLRSPVASPVAAPVAAPVAKAVAKDTSTVSGAAANAPSLIAGLAAVVVFRLL